MENLDLIGRIIFSLYWVLSGAMHFKDHKGLTGYATSKNLPAPQAVVILSGILMLLAGLGILFEYYEDYSMWALIVFLLLASFLFHNFWADTDHHQKMNNMIAFLKNFALIGALLMLLA